MSAWASAFFFTQLIEIPIYLSLLKSKPLSVRLWHAFAASLLTHPLVWFVLAHVLPGPYWVRVAQLELFAIGMEMLYFRMERETNWWWPPVVANVASAGLGFLCRYLFGWP